jgi:hypothetical protein
MLTYRALGSQLRYHEAVEKPAQQVGVVAQMLGTGALALQSR